jgi:DNA-binding IclR family transcriptional regulator
MPKIQTKYNVPALEKALAIIEALAEQDEPMGTSHLCKLLDIPKTSVFFILNTLEHNDYISKSDDGRYKLGTKFVGIGLSILNKMNIKEFAKPCMEKLLKETGFTVHLAILDHGEAMYIDKSENDGYVKFSTYIGQRHPLHTTGVGKALAAYLSEEQLDKIIQSKSLLPRTENTITSIAHFKSALEMIRSQGYAIEDEEGEIGIRCIGAAIFNHENQLAASISVTTLRSELPIQEIPLIGEKVKLTAMEISRRLGYKQGVVVQD